MNGLLHFHGTRLSFESLDGRWSVRDEGTGKAVEVTRELRLAIADELARMDWSAKGQIERRRARYTP